MSLARSVMTFQRSAASRQRKPWTDRTRHAATWFAGAVLLLAGCSGPAHHDVSPIPTTADAHLDFCGPVSRYDIVTTLGTAKFTYNGSIQQLHASENANPDGTRLNIAGCQAYTKTSRGESLSVDVIQIGVLRDADAQIAQKVHDRKADYYYPRSIGVGYASYTQVEDTNHKTHRAGVAAVLWGDWRIIVHINLPASWRDPLKDAVAISEQVGHRLALPTKPTRPYPTPTTGR